MPTEKVRRSYRNYCARASLRVTTDVYMQAVGPQKREAQSNLVKLVRRDGVSDSNPA